MKEGLNDRLGELSAEISMCQRKGVFCFTNEDSQKQKTLEEPVSDNAIVQASERPHVSYFAHAELARLVVDVESMHTQNTHGSVLGQSRKVAQEEVAQTGSGVGLSGLGPDFPLSEYGAGKEGRRGGARREDMCSIQEQRIDSKVEKEANNFTHVVLGNELKKKPLELEGAEVGNVTSDATFGLGNHHSRSEKLLGGDEDGGRVGRGVKTYQRRRKTKGLVDLDCSMSHPRRSVRIRNKCPQSAFSTHSRQGLPAVSLSDGDIDNCNLRLRESDSSEEPVKLWEISRKVGIRCRKDEQEVLQVFLFLEERDVKTMRSAEEGKKGGLL